MPNFRSLQAWRLAKSLAIECSKVARRFPGGERHPLAAQLLRACYSVPLNIAEGSGRRGLREYRRFLNIARGSLTEVQAALEIAREAGYVEPEDGHRLETLAAEAARTLWGLLRRIRELDP
jgi:four helix bundle protein